MLVAHSGFNLKLNYGAPAKAETSYQYQIVRLLIGTATIVNGRKEIKQKLDYSSLPAVLQAISPAGAIKSFFGSYSMSGSQRVFIQETSAGNRDFYKEILHDFCAAFIQRDKGCHSAAFVFVYRILERMLYSVPLIYASRQKDFIGTFKSLKDLLQGKDAGEYSLYNKLIDKGNFIDQLKLDVYYPFDFSASGVHKNRHFMIMNRYFQSEIDSPNTAVCSGQIKMKHVGKFIYTLRNRFFHTRTGEGQINIKSHELGDVDAFFQGLNEIFLSYLSIVALEIIAVDYNR